MFIIKSVLIFENLPKTFLFNKKIIFAVLDFSGIQKYIFGDLTKTSNQQEIYNRSKYVEKLTQKIAEKISVEFSGKNGFLDASISSGKISVIFSNKIDLIKLNEYLSSLQRSVFATTKGKLTFYFAFCVASCIKSSSFKSNTMQPVNITISALLQEEKFSCENLLLTDMQKEYNIEFSEENLLTKTTINEDLTGVYGAIKLDLDNLGAFFSGIKEFDKKKRVSLELDKIIKDCILKTENLVPIFSGGDDIFFICNLNDWLNTVSDFYIKLKNALVNSESLLVYAKNYFGISAGVSVIREIENASFLYYSETAENALTVAKTGGGKNCLCVLLPDKEQRIISWSDFLTLSEIYKKVQNKIFKNSSVFLKDTADLRWLKNQLLKHQQLNKTLLSRKDVKEIEQLTV